MTPHLFLLTPGEWLGEGKISFSMSPDTIPYYTRWDVQGLENNEITAVQMVEMQGAGEALLNQFRFFDLSSSSFNVELSNEMLGVVQGTGLIEPESIAWEFRNHPTFEGFEVYRRKSTDESTDEYSLHAEYSSPDHHRTIVHGRVWKKVS